MEIKVDRKFLDTRLGKKINKKVIDQILTSLGYEFTYKNNEYDITVPTWRSTGDVSIKDDVMGDIARILTFDSFEAKPITISFDKCVGIKGHSECGLGTLCDNECMPSFYFTFTILNAVSFCTSIIVTILSR